MRAHTALTVLAILLGAGFAPEGKGVYAQEPQDYAIETRVWMDRGHEPVLQRGESVRLYYRVAQDAFVAIFHIDTNGTARMVFPRSPQENHFARGGRDYRVLFPGSTYWYVNEDPGMGYFFAVASPRPFNFADLRYSHYDGGWDLSYVGRQVYRDPYLAMDDYVSTLIPDWEYVPYGLDFTAYHVEQRYEYPRFMCYDCHGFRPYSVWNPYHYSCATFRVVIYNDPYYYPVYRYRGTRVVYVQPRRGIAHFGFKERAAGEVGTPQVVYRSSPGVPQPGVAGTETRRAQPRGSNPAGASTPTPGAASRRSAPGAGSGSPSGVERRPSSPGPTRLTPPSSAPGTNRRSGVTETRPLSDPEPGVSRTTPEVRRVTEPGRSPSATPPGATQNRPVLERRPAAGSTAVPRTPPAATVKPAPRPSAKVRRGGGGSTGGGGTPSATRSNGGSGNSSPPAARSGGTSTRTPVSRSSPAPRATVRQSGGSGSRPSATPRAPTVRSSGGTGSRPSATRRQPSVQRSGGSATRAPAATRRPVVRKKKPGGGSI